jgi:nucleoside-diphosphate-sugar epimerase
MTEPILITGGTGTIGRHLVPLLLDARRDVRVLSRQRRPEEPSPAERVRGDLATGEGLEKAVDGVGTIVHCAGSAKGDKDKALHLVEVAR